MTTTITLPESLVQELMKKAEECGVCIEEYLADLIISDPDPRRRAQKYIKCALELLEQAKDGLRKGDLRQASEKTWGACALSIKAYALAREGKILETHMDLWRYKSVVAEELGDWVRDVWYAANTMHRNFNENLADHRDIEKALEKVAEPVKIIAEKLSKS
ncbi:MAG TPA: hypothetical protein ENG44_02385 [Desulfurococcaceae archaeon]|nr:hypothetical protein [Desulfurococcaceae archaeon]